MNRDYDYSVLSSPQEAVVCSQVMAQSFVVGAEEEFHYLQQAGFDQCRVLRQGQDIVGGLVLLPMAQWFGGRPVSTTGVASVAIAAHCRGQGAATHLMNAVIRELSNQDVALSTLYPAVQSLYQKVGYGLGGSRYVWRVATDQIHQPQAPFPCYGQAVVEVEPYWQALQQKQASASQGHLDRHPLLWQRLLQSPGSGATLSYSVNPTEASRGYCITYQERKPEGTILTLRDWAAPSLTAMKSIWALLYQQRSQVDIVQWAGGAIDPLGLALPEQSAQIITPALWMIRIVNVHQALTQRGYPAAISGELHLHIRDPLVAKNQGRFVLQIDQGYGQLISGGRGNLAIDIQHLASLYTSLRTAEELHALGQLTAPIETLPLATAVFSGPLPWMPDFF